MKVFSIALILTCFFKLSAQAAPIEVFQTERASLAFQTWVRVEVAAKVVGAEDSSIIGESSPYLQSLLYTSSKQFSFLETFKTANEIRSRVLNDFCEVRHDVDLKPNREAGALGTRVFRQKIKAFLITVNGTHKIDDKIKPFEVTVVCNKI